MSADPAKLRAEIEALQRVIADKDAEIEKLKGELAVAVGQSSSRWQAIEKLAPAAKRLRIERDKLRAELDAKRGD